MMTPHLSLTGDITHTENEKAITCILRNSGLGPAKIKSVEVSIEDLKLEKLSSLNLWSAIRDFIENSTGLFFDDTSGALHVAALESVSILPANEEILILKLEIFDEKISVVDILEKIHGKIRVKIHYESLYEKQYSIDEIIQEDFKIPV
ncbi:hypothetical protein [Methylophaga thalassica]|uniref:hypothetical protein n=1 Tax=Methylophaga thalassica TaxID=40223 RepID=UPI002E7BE2DA|nr:hypothetical protein [Methylophaga thalassica]WVI84941.1 hypothetical protein VSX76_14325 [Methylophaga thalassica]